MVHVHAHPGTALGTVQVNCNSALPILRLSWPVCVYKITLFSGTRDSCGFFTHLTEVIKESLGHYFSGRPDLKIIAEPGTIRLGERGVNSSEGGD